MQGTLRPASDKTVWHPTDIGPSLLSIDMDGDQSVYRAMLWVGGTRFDAHGEGTWGKNITMTFRIPSHQRGYDIELGVGETMEKHRKQLITVFGEQAGTAILKAIPAIAGGYVFRRSMTPEEVLEGMLR